MSTSKKISEKVLEFTKNLSANLEKDPRYLINFMAKEDGTIRIYFASEHEYNLYKEGKASIGSTERFCSGDIFCNVPKERIEKITDGMTIAHINAINEEETNG